MRHLSGPAAACAGFTLAAAAAYAFLPSPSPSVSLRVVAHPRVPPGILTLEASYAPAGRRGPPESKQVALRVVRIARSGDQEVLMPPEEGDDALLALSPGRPVRLDLAVPIVTDADESTIVALLFEDAREGYLREIGDRQTVSPEGIALHARASLTFSSGPRGIMVQAE